MSLLLLLRMEVERILYPQAVEQLHQFLLILELIQQRQRHQKLYLKQVQRLG